MKNRIFSWINLNLRRVFVQQCCQNLYLQTPLASLMFCSPINNSLSQSLSLLWLHSYSYFPIILPLCAVCHLPKLFRSTTSCSLILQLKCVCAQVKDKRPGRLADRQADRQTCSMRGAGLEKVSVIAVLEVRRDSRRPKATQLSLIKGGNTHKQPPECKCGALRMC